MKKYMALTIPILALSMLGGWVDSYYRDIGLIAVHNVMMEDSSFLLIGTSLPPTDVSIWLRIDHDGSPMSHFSYPLLGYRTYDIAVSESIAVSAGCYEDFDRGSVEIVSIDGDYIFFGDFEEFREFNVCRIVTSEEVQLFGVLSDHTMGSARLNLTSGVLEDIEYFAEYSGIKGVLETEEPGFILYGGVAESAKIWFFSEEGEFIEERVYPEIDYFRKMKINDGIIYALGNCYFGDSSGVARFNLALDFIGIDYFDFDSSEINFKDIAFSDEGNIFIAGSEFLEPDSAFAFIFAYDTLGQIVREPRRLDVGERVRATEVDNIYIVGDSIYTIFWNVVFWTSIAKTGFDFSAERRNEYSYHEEAVEEIGRPEEITIKTYPNPFNSSIKIEIPKGSQGFEIYDFSGRLIHSSENIIGQQSINWTPQSDVASGVYLVSAIGTSLSNFTKVVYIE